MATVVLNSRFLMAQLILILFLCSCLSTIGTNDRIVSSWQKHLKFEPVPPLLRSVNLAIPYFAKRDLLSKQVIPIEELWNLCKLDKVYFRRQRGNGSWEYPGGGIESLRSKESYDQLETYRILGELVEKYGLDKQHRSITRASEYLFSFQTEEGDFRGIYGNQYTPNYSAAITELLVKAGYDSDSRIKKGFRWLLSIRQNDGGWAIPMRTVGMKYDRDSLYAATVHPDKSRPFSHMVTGIVLRAFAAHNEYRKSKEARVAGELLSSRLFVRDKYPDRQSSNFWTGFSFPFWFTDLLSALDSLSLLRFSAEHAPITRALHWLEINQHKNGSWKLRLLKGRDKPELGLWTTLAICRVFKRFYG
jgi:squalene-hopene cyclase-like protein